MRRVLLFSIVAAAALAIGMGMGAVAAQDGEPANETVSGSAEYEVEFGDDLRILEYEVDDGTATITFEADEPKTVTVADALAGADTDEPVQVPEEDYDLEPGETTVTMDVNDIDGWSIVSVEVDGLTVQLSDEHEPSDPLRHFGGLSGLFTGIGMTVAIAAVAAYYVVKREDSGVIEA